MNADTTKFHSEQEKNPNGDYSNTTTIKNANGTQEELSNTKSTSNHWRDKGTTSTITRSHTIDLNGLGNKQNVELKEKTETSPDGSKKTTFTKKVSSPSVTENSKVVN